MDTRKSILLVLFLFSAFGLTCDLNEELDEYAKYENVYNLLMPLEVAPLKKVYQVNDTIELSTIIRKQGIK